MNIPEIKRVNFETSAGASLKVFLEVEAEKENGYCLMAKN